MTRGEHVTEQVYLKKGERTLIDALVRAIRALRAELVEMTPTKDEPIADRDAYDELFIDLVALSKHKRELMGHDADISAPRQGVWE